jgi:biotin carboxyl carrier protein
MGSGREKTSEERVMAMYRVSVGNREYQVEVSGNRLKLNGELIQANLTALNELGLYLLRRGDSQREIHVSTRGSSTFFTLGEGRHLVAQVAREDSHRPRTAAPAAQSNVCAPMPGVLIKTLVEVGCQVEKGQAVVVMESMKMQMELRAPVSGTVASLEVEPRSQVEKGTLLVKITA